jgi:hypothetical protein
LGDAGELLDDQAKAEYRRRLSQLHKNWSRQSNPGRRSAPDRSRRKLMR